MSRKVNPPIATLAQVDINSPQGKRALIEILDQIYNRLGGATDLVDSSDSNSSTMSSRLVAMVNDAISQIEDLRGELNVVRSLLRASVSENENCIQELKARASRTDAKIAAINEKTDELEGMI